MRMFKTPVVVEPGVLGRFRIVTGPADALKVMHTQWPERETEKYKKALTACREAAAGKVPPHVARSSFVAAARSVRILVLPEEFRRYTVGSINPLQASREAGRRY